MAEWQIEPWGETRADLRAAMIAWTMASIWRGKAQRRPKIEDFILKFGQSSKITDPVQMEFFFKQLAMASQARQRRSNADDQRKT